MSVWEFSFTIRQFVLDFSVVGVLLVLGIFIRSKVRFFQRFLIPANLIAGFLGLAIGPELIGMIDVSPERMGVYVYHLLALTFIGVGLRRSGGVNIAALHLGCIKVVTFIFQGLIGVGIGLLFLWLFNPDLIPAVGMLLPLGFGMGPGIAYSIGQSWDAYGFPEAANIGLTLAAIGFLVAYGTGMAVVNRGVRKGQTELISEGEMSHSMRTGVVRDEPNEIGSRLTFFSGAIDTLTFHFALIGAIYLVTYGLMILMGKVLVAAGLGREVPTLWSLNFVFANLIALGVRKVMDRNGAARVIDDGTVNRMTGLLADILIATSIMAISLSIAWQYIGPIAVMSALGAVVTYYTIKWSILKTFPDYAFERAVGLYAEQTGTISSGLALIRVMDPEFVTPVAQDQVVASAVTLAVGFPLLILINLPLAWYGGSMEGYAVVIGLLLAYLVLLLLGWWLLVARNTRTS